MIYLIGQSYIREGINNEKYSKYLSVVWSDSRLLLPQGEPHTLLTAGG